MALHLGNHELLETDRPFEALLSQPGVSEVLRLGSRFGFMAFHGGWLEEVTDDIASAASDRSGASYYGVLQGPNNQWHIPSRLVNPEESRNLQLFIDHVDVVVAIHGFGRPDLPRSVLLGGQNRDLAEFVACRLIGYLPQYEIVHDLSAMPIGLRGQHAKNPVNLTRGGGVQVELPPRIRGKSPLWTGFKGPGRVPHHEALINGLATAARDWSARYESS